MGFLDKAMSQVQQAAKQGQDKLDDLQAKKASDGLLRDLGAWYYATETGRDNGQGPGEIARLLGALKAHEAEHGALGGGADQTPDSGTPEGTATAAPAAPAPPATPAPVASSVPATADAPAPPPPATPATQPAPAEPAPAPSAPPPAAPPAGGFTLDDL